MESNRHSTLHFRYRATTPPPTRPATVRHLHSIPTASATSHSAYHPHFFYPLTALYFILLLPITRSVQLFVSGSPLTRLCPVRLHHQPSQLHILPHLPLHPQQLRASTLRQLHQQLPYPRLVPTPTFYLVQPPSHILPHMPKTYLMLQAQLLLHRLVCTQVIAPQPSHRLHRARRLGLPRLDFDDAAQVAAEDGGSRSSGACAASRGRRATC